MSKPGKPLDDTQRARLERHLDMADSAANIASVGWKRMREDLFDEAISRLVYLVRNFNPARNKDGEKGFRPYAWPYVIKACCRRRKKLHAREQREPWQTCHGDMRQKDGAEVQIPAPAAVVVDLVEATERLSPLYTKVILMRFRDGMSYKEIGDSHGRTREWARILIKDAVNAIRRRYQ